MIDFISTSTRPLSPQERNANYQYNKQFHTELNHPIFNVFSQQFNKEFQQ
jgi:hypothetical protein